MPWVAAWTIKPKITGALHRTTRCRYCKRIQFMIQDPSAASHPLTVQLQNWCVMFDSTSFQRFFLCDSAPSLTDSELEGSVKVLLRTTAPPLTSSMEPGCAGNSGERMDQEGHWQSFCLVLALRISGFLLSLRKAVPPFLPPMICNFFQSHRFRDWAVHSSNSSRRTFLDARFSKQLPRRRKSCAIPRCGAKSQELTARSLNWMRSAWEYWFPTKATAERPISLIIRNAETWGH